MAFNRFKLYFIILLTDFKTITKKGGWYKVTLGIKRDQRNSIQAIRGAYFGLLCPGLRKVELRVFPGKGFASQLKDLNEGPAQFKIKKRRQGNAFSI